MKTLTTKPEKLTVISFKEFVEYVKRNSPEPHWSTHLYGVAVTHENDSHYILMPENGQVDFRSGQRLVVRKDFSMFTIPESDLTHQLADGIFEWDFMPYGEVEKSLTETLSKHQPK